MSTQPLSIYTKEEERGARLSYLLCNGATRAYRHVGHNILKIPKPPADLHSFLTSNKNYFKLQRLKGHVINQEQWNLLFPPIPLLPDSDTFDVTLWSIILRTICNLTPPLNGWNVDPVPGDHSLTAELVRLRLCRNRFIAHTASLSFCESLFNVYWQQVEDILMSLGGIPKTEIDRRKTESLDPNQLVKYNSLLNQLHLTEELLDNEVETIKKKQIFLIRAQAEQSTQLKALQGNSALNTISVEKLQNDLKSQASGQSQNILKVKENQAIVMTEQGELSTRIKVLQESSDLNAANVGKLHRDLKSQASGQAHAILRVKENQVELMREQGEQSIQIKMLQESSGLIVTNLEDLHEDLKSQATSQKQIIMKVNEHAADINRLKGKFDITTITTST